jgi:mono/diheme cytochrome c family protein
MTLIVPLVVVAAACSQPGTDTATPAETAAPSQPAQAPAERGKYVVTVGGCNDCHTPKTMTAAGPVPDEKLLLSGHPAGEKLPAIPKGVIAPDQWGALTNNNLTAWAGPWGVSFTRNLTPDTATGLGSWTESMFIKTLRDGKHQGEGRPLLPPMPWQMYAQMTDDDLKAVFAYLRSIPAINNPVPEPIAPAGAPPAPPK